jgi:hydroxypyruvate isomerase
MNRRDFIVSSSAAVSGGVGAASMLTAPVAAASPASSTAVSRGEKFKLNYAPHDGMFRHHAGDDFIDQIKFMADEGFTAIEDNGLMGRSAEQQDAIGRELSRLGMTMGVFVTGGSIAWKPSLATGKQEFLDEFLADCRKALDAAKRVNAKWSTVVPGQYDHRREMAYQTASVVDALRRACELFEPAGLIMVLEPLNPWRDHPGQFLTRIPQAFEICRAVNSPSCKILDDLYHQQITEGNLIPNIDMAWSEIAYFQTGDNPGRNEPGTGEINYQNVFRHIHARGFTGVIGMEHGNSMGGKEGERAVIEAYRRADGF